MSDNRKYYYMRIKENFFDSDEIKLLESIPNVGYKYSNILLKMYLKSLKFNGRLMFNDTMPYNAEMLSVVTGHSIGDVKDAIEKFKALGLIEVFDSGEIYMLDIQSFIGKTSTEADRIKAYRREVAQKKIQGVQMYNERTPELDIELDIDIDKDIENNIVPHSETIDTVSNSDLKKQQKAEEQKQFELQFETLWKKYPKKSGKPMALRSFLKAVKAGVEIDLISKKLDEYNQQIDFRKTEKQYIKNGSTWFNQQGWLDEYEVGKRNARNVDTSQMTEQEIYDLWIK